MAKIALIFLLFALFAVAMAGRVTREEATKSPVEEIQENLKKFANSDAVKELAKGIETFGNGTLKLVKDVYNELNLQKTGGKS